MSKSLIILIALLFSSCTTSNLVPKGVTAEVARLAESNNREIILRVTDSFKLQRLGHQYLAVLFPFGEIKHESLEQALTQKLYTELAMRGYRPRLDLTSPEESKVDELVIDLRNIQLTAYDLVMTRKVVCKVKIQGKVNAVRYNIPITYTVNSTYSEYRTMPFNTQLQRILDKGLSIAIKDILNQLRL